jgi:PEP-CTERM motif
MLTILVGGRGGDGASNPNPFWGGGGGGGATFVVLSQGDPLLVAGGGGGGGVHPGGAGGGYTGVKVYPREGGASSLTLTGGGGGVGYFDPFSGVHVSGNGGSFIPGGGGGGYNDGIAAGGVSYDSGGAGGSGGTGGGGGSPLACVCGGWGGPSGGGGGGYGGGDAGGVYSNDGGYGGSSFLDGLVTALGSIAGENVGNGYVTIESMSTTVPEPSTWAMMLIGFVGLGFARHRRAVVQRVPNVSPRRVRPLARSGFARGDATRGLICGVAERFSHHLPARASG